MAGTSAPRLRTRPARHRRLAARCCAVLAAAVISAGAEDVDAEGSCPASGCTAVGSAESAWRPKTLSVVLPCANEGEFALKTARAVSESVPGGGGGEILSEIVVVDDGSSPPISDALPADLQRRYGVRIVRHERSKGLIQAKAAGAAHTTGDVIVFFDCHVGPQPGWHAHFLEAIAPNWKRIVVPSITNLNIETWQQDQRHTAVNKCYLTWDADFKWFRSNEPFMPVLSGGLLGISRRWWDETGGYDVEMKNWGGENVDQSLRTWLCGGEIMSVPEAEVAHMWRKAEDNRTTAKYETNFVNSITNRARAAKGWFGNFTFKLDQYPAMTYVKWRKLNTSSFDAVRDRLGCKPFAWFLWRFRHIYEDAGLVPESMFRIRHIRSSKCLTYMGPSGTHPKGMDKVSLLPCGEMPPAGPLGPPHTAAQFWHKANKGSDGKCCSGLRVYNTDQCLSMSSGVQTHICEVFGRIDQVLSLTTAGDNTGAAPGQLRHPRGFCLVKHKATLLADRCKEVGSQVSRPVWEYADGVVTPEFEVYQQAKLDNPALFVQ